MPIGMKDLAHKSNRCIKKQLRCTVVHIESARILYPAVIRKIVEFEKVMYLWHIVKIAHSKGPLPLENLEVIHNNSVQRFQLPTGLKNLLKES